MKKQMMIQALFAMMLGFAVPAVYAADADDELNKKIAGLAVQMVGEFDPEAEAFAGLDDIADDAVVEDNKAALAQARKIKAAQVAIRVLQGKNIEGDEFNLDEHHQVVEALEPVTDWQKEQKAALQEAIVVRRAALAEIAKVIELQKVNVGELSAEDLAAYKVKVLAIKDGTLGKDELVQAIQDREAGLAAAAAAIEEEVGKLDTADAVKAFMLKVDKKTAVYLAALEEHLGKDGNAALKEQVKAQFDAYKVAVNPVPAPAGMSKMKKAGYVVGGVTIVALGYEVFGRVLPKMSQLKRRQKHDESLQGKNMFVEALREEYKAARRGLNRGYEGLKGFFADEDEDDQDEDDAVQE